MSHRIDLDLAKKTIAGVLKKHEIHDLCYVGCGASKADLYPAVYFCSAQAKSLRVHLFTASEFNHDTPAWLGEHSLVISASLGGATPETVQANAVAKAAGAYVISLTNKEGSALTKDADVSIVHGWAENYAAKLEKKGYALALGLETLQQTEGTDLYEHMVEGLNSIFDLCEDATAKSLALAAEFGRAYKDAPVIYVQSSGASMQVAYATSVCLMMEMQWINSGYFHTGEFFHGPFEIVDKDAHFVLLMNEGATRAVDARALTFMQRFGSQVTVVDAKDYGLSAAVPSDVVTYFNPFVHTAVFRTYAEALAEERQHPLTLRRYMWKLEY